MSRAAGAFSRFATTRFEVGQLTALRDLGEDLFADLLEAIQLHLADADALQVGRLDSAVVENRRDGCTAWRRRQERRRQLAQRGRAGEHPARRRGKLGIWPGGLGAASA